MASSIPDYKIVELEFQISKIPHSYYMSNYLEIQFTVLLW